MDRLSATTAAIATAPNLVFSHFGMTVRDMPTMERFYTDVLGYSVTDRGTAAGLQFVFLTRDANEHHQIVLTDGRPANIPPNTANPHVGPCIQHIAFRMGSLADLRDICTRLEAGGATGIRPVTHGVMWSVYAHDPESNPLEFYVMTDWYINQPFILDLDFTKSDAELTAMTKELCERSSGFEPLTSWQARLAERVTPFLDPRV
jgi:catechol 2,3-dioxygenase